MNDFINLLENFSGGHLAPHLREKGGRADSSVLVRAAMERRVQAFSQGLCLWENMHFPEYS
jgi:hypothetical protein